MFNDYYLLLLILLYYSHRKRAARPSLKTGQKWTTGCGMWGTQTFFTTAAVQKGNRKQFLKERGERERKEWWLRFYGIHFHLDNDLLFFQPDLRDVIPTSKLFFSYNLNIFSNCLPGPLYGWAVCEYAYTYSFGERQKPINSVWTHREPMRAGCVSWLPTTETSAWRCVN